MTFPFIDIMVVAARYFYTNKTVTSVEESLGSLAVPAQNQQQHWGSVTRVKKHSLLP